MRPVLWLAACLFPLCHAEAAEPPHRLLLLAQSPDGHPPMTHEYLAGLRRLEGLLRKTDGVEPRLVMADGPWTDGPELLDGADGAVLFLSEGAKWLSAQPERLAAFRRLAERKGGLSCLHWAMGTKVAEPIGPFVDLLGGCHGGPDRKYRVLQTEVRPVGEHSITQGITPFEAQDEFYFALKWTTLKPPPTPLIQVTIDEEPQTVSWSWERPDGGRSFGFSGLHFDRNWELEGYRRLVLQGVLWTLRQEIPDQRE